MRYLASLIHYFPRTWEDWREDGVVMLAWFSGILLVGGLLIYGYYSAVHAPRYPMGLTTPPTTTKVVQVTSQVTVTAPHAPEGKQVGERKSTSAAVSSTTLPTQLVAQTQLPVSTTNTQSSPSTPSTPLSPSSHETAKPSAPASSPVSTDSVAAPPSS